MGAKEGFFISFDGPEGSGKSSQLRLLVRALEQAGLPVLAIRDPGSTRLGAATRRILLHANYALDAKTETLLFWAGRVELVESMIRPALKKGHVVVCDRYHDATVAYQGYGGVLDPDWIDAMGREMIGYVMPQLTFLLDLSVEAGFERLQRRHDRMERKAKNYHRRVRKGYLALAQKEPKRFCIINAAKDKASIHRDILSAVAERLPQSRSVRLKQWIAAHHA